jgi:hypothetical protein
MDTNTPIGNQAITWGTALASGLQDFPTIVHILNTEGLSSDPSALITFMGDPATSQALYALLSSLDNAHTAARDEITISQNQL